MTGSQVKDTGRTVLLVSSGRDQEAIEASLRAAGFTPEVLAGPVEAIVRAARDPGSVAGALIRVDNLRDEDLDVVAALRRTLPRAVLIVIHSAASREKAARALLLGADAALDEPFYWIELVALLGRIDRRAPREVAIGAPDPDREMDLVARLAGGVAHEINNPLTIISGWVQVLLTEVPESEPRHRTLAAIRDEAARIARVVRDLQTFARRKTPVLAPVDLNALIRTELTSSEIAPKLERLETTLRLDASLPPVSGDAAQLGELIRQLLRNAAAATPEGGTIVVETEVSDVVSLGIRDSGRGIPEGERDRIFDPFFSGSASGQGPGLGLAVALAIARTHGGDLVLQETGDRGTLFRLTLPRRPGSQESSA